MNRVLLLALMALLAACSRENRDTTPSQPREGAEHQILMSSNTLSSPQPAPAADPAGKEYETSAYHVNQGKKFFSQFNCNGCHSNGGGGSGPPLMDDNWIYGSSIENIVQTIREGRPNGMPSFRAKIADEQIWELAAYVRALGGLLPADIVPGRNDDLNAREPEGQLVHQAPVQGGAASPAEQMPQ